MKPRLLQYLFVACVLSMSVSASADASAERPIRQSIDRLAQAWTAADDAKWAAEYWPEGELVNILGDIMPNAAAVRDRTAQILAGPFKGSYFESSVRRIQLLGVDVAVVDTDIRLTNFRALQPGSVATLPNLLLTRMKQVYQRRDRVWRIASAQNAAVAPGVRPSVPAGTKTGQ